MVDAESVERRLHHIGIQVGALRDIAERGRDSFMTDELVRTAAERFLQVAIQAAADVANHILAEDSDLTPDDYGAAFVALAKLGVIDQELAERLRAAAGLRNVLVHLYLDVDPDRVWEAIESLDDLEAFAAAVERYLARGSNPGPRPP